MRTKQLAAVLIAIAGLMLTACAQEPSKAPAGDLESGVSAIEDTMTMPSEDNAVISEPIGDLRDGSLADTTPTPDDFPADHQYGCGKIEDYDRAYIPVLRKQSCAEIFVL